MTCLGKLSVPKGSMCMACVNLYTNCSHLPFEEYKPIVKHKDGIIEVKCELFKRKGE